MTYFLKLLRHLPVNLAFSLFVLYFWIYPDGAMEIDPYVVKYFSYFVLLELTLDFLAIAFLMLFYKDEEDAKGFKIGIMVVIASFGLFEFLKKEIYGAYILAYLFLVAVRALRLLMLKNKDRAFKVEAVINIQRFYILVLSFFPALTPFLPDLGLTPSVLQSLKEAGMIIPKKTIIWAFTYFFALGVFDLFYSKNVAQIKLDIEENNPKGLKKLYRKFKR